MISASTFYDARISQPVDISRMMFGGGTTFGRSRIGLGDLVLANLDGGLDDLINYGFDGRNVAIYRHIAKDMFLADVTVYDPTLGTTKVLHFASGLGLATPSVIADGDYELVSFGTMEQAEFSVTQVIIKLRDRQYELSTPLQTTKYAGTNALPAGLEGVANDLKGKVKPVCYGTPMNVPAPCVNTSKLTYQANDGALADIAAVYDRGVSITKGADYATSALLQAAAPAAGTYITCFAEGYFRLGSSPAGLVTCDPVEGVNAADRTAAQTFSKMLNRAAAANPNLISKGLVNFVTDTGVQMVTDTGVLLVLSSDVSNADLIALDAANSAVLGYWTDQPTTVGQACDLVAASVGAWWGVDAGGIFRIQQFTAPSGMAALTITANDMKKPLARLSTNDPGHGLPIYRSTVRYGRIYAVQDTDLAGSVTDARRAVVSQEWRESVSTDLSIQVSNLFAPEQIDESLLTTEADALAESARRLALRKVRRDLYDVTVELNSETRVLDISSIVELVHPRFGLSLVGSSVGALFRVLDLQPNAADRSLRLTVWGKATGNTNLVTDTGAYLVTDGGAYLIAAA